MLEPRTTTTNSAAVTRAEQNRLNALHSTGPRTDTGKAISKLNAVKTGLTGRTVLLPTDDAARYEQHVQNWCNELNPEGPRECALVQSIADSHWRTERIVRLEFALYAAGGEAPTQGESALPSEGDELATFLRYERQLRNLSTQENRLRRSRNKDLQELQDLQKDRRERCLEEAAAAAQTARRTTAAASISTPPAKPETKRTTSTGFVFATVATERSNELTGSEKAASWHTPQGK